MNITDNGGPAFPTTMPGFNKEGMSLRDYLAAAALQGIRAGDHDNKISNPDRAAEWAYEFADAMLKVRNESK